MTKFTDVQTRRVNSTSAAPARRPVAGDLGAVEPVAKTAWTYAPAVCRALDPLLDMAVDAEDARAGGKVTVWRRIGDDLAAASDSICASTGGPNTPAERLAAIVRAIGAAEKANRALDALGGAAKPATPTSAAPNGPALSGRSFR